MKKSSSNPNGTRSALLAASAALFAGAQLPQFDKASAQRNTIYQSNEAQYLSGAPSAYMGNEATGSQGLFSVGLTDYAVGWKSPDNIEADLEAAFPSVEAARFYEYKMAVNAEGLLSEFDDIRSIGSSFKRVEYNQSSVLGKTLNKGLTIRLDRDQYPDIDRESTRATGRLIDRLYRNEMRRGIALLIAGAVNTNVTWSSGTPQPDEDLNAANLASMLTSGLRPTNLIYAVDAWAARRLAYSKSNTSSGFAGYNSKIQDLADSLNMGKGMFLPEIYQSAAAAKLRILAGIVLFYNAQQGVGLDDPSCVKRFFTPTESGKMRVFQEQVGPKFVDITVEHYSTIAVTAGVGIGSLTVS